MADKTERHKRPKSVFLFLNLINILTQHRQTFTLEDTRSLADNICHYGLLDPLVVASFTREVAQEYIDLINRFYKTAHCLKEITPTIDGRYQIILSGERRLRAHWLIWESGCSSCREAHGQEESGVCYHRHFGIRKRDKKIETRLYFNLSAAEAIDIQLSGNCYVPPKEQEMVATYALQFSVKKKKNPKLSIAEFARSVGKSPDTMSGYLRVFNLPEEIYYYYQEKLISFGIAQELAFLKDQGESNLNFWAKYAIAKKMKVDAFHQKIREYLKKKNQTILEIFDECSIEEANKLFIRKTVAKEMVADLHLGVAYWRKVLRLFEEGMLGKDDSPFSEGSPLHILRKQMDLHKNHVLPHLENLLPRHTVQEFAQTLDIVEITLARMEAKQEKEMVAVAGT